MRRAKRGPSVGWAATLLAIAVAAAAQVAAAPPPPAPPKSPAPSPGAVAVTILGIRATREAKPAIDPALQPVADELRMSKYNSFRLVVSDTRNVPVGGAMDVAMIEDYSMRIQVEKADDDTAQLVLSWIHVEKDSQGKTHEKVVQRLPMCIRKGKYFLSGGWTLKEGALLGAVAVK